MKELRGRVAVITGAASGIGLALARRLAREGMRIVVADIDQDAAAEAAASLCESGHDAVAFAVDVSSDVQVDALADAAFDRFGAVHLLANNAGVLGEQGPTWERSLETWRWLLGVNLWGVVHGLRSFLPRMIAQNAECHVVNTASMAGLIGVPLSGAYAASKFAVVGLSESVARELRQLGTKIGVTVVCPGVVKTQIGSDDRNRPSELRDDVPPGERDAAVTAMTRAALESGMDSSAVADLIVASVRENRMYCLTHVEVKDLVRRRLDVILAGP